MGDVRLAIDQGHTLDSVLSTSDTEEQGERGSTFDTLANSHTNTLPAGSGANDEKSDTTGKSQSAPAVPTNAAEEPGGTTEDKLQASVSTSLKGNDAATKAFNKLVQSSDYRALPDSARVALLSQVKNYPDARSVSNLQLLASRQWFKGASLSDQQRSAKLVAFASQDSTGNTQIINNALHFVLSNSGLTMNWGDFEQQGDNVTFGTHLKDENGDNITLNRQFVPDGDGFLPATANAKHVSEETLAHEVNHDLNNDQNNVSYRYFMGEYRAWYVGFQASHGRPPNQQECFVRAQYLVQAGSYSTIKDAFDATKSDDSKKIVRFIARINGEDPDKATSGSVLNPNDLSTTGTGLAPEAATPEDPNNLDDHN